jgi:hypothetical protein
MTLMVLVLVLSQLVIAQTPVLRAELIAATAAGDDAKALARLQQERCLARWRGACKQASAERMVLGTGTSSQQQGQLVCSPLVLAYLAHQHLSEALCRVWRTGGPPTPQSACKLTHT